MKKKKLATLVATLTLTGVVIVGGTLAYLTTQTGTISNVFTVGNISINIIEPDWNPDDADELSAGVEVKKNPQLINVGKNSGYVVMQVDGVAEMHDFKVTYLDEEENIIKNWNNKDWTYLTLGSDSKYVVADTQPATLTDGYYVYNTVLEKEQITNPLFSRVAFVGAETVTSYQITGVDVEPKDGVADYYIINGKDSSEDDRYATREAVEAKVSELANSESLTFSLDVTGYAIQNDGFTGETAMLDAINELLGVK